MDYDLKYFILNLLTFCMTMQAISNDDHSFDKYVGMSTYCFDFHFFQFYFFEREYWTMWKFLLFYRYLLLCCLEISVADFGVDSQLDTFCFYLILKQQLAFAYYYLFCFCFYYCIYPYRHFGFYSTIYYNFFILNSFYFFTLLSPYMLAYLL